MRVADSGSDGGAERLRDKGAKHFVHGRHSGWRMVRVTEAPPKAVWQGRQPLYSQDTNRAMGRGPDDAPGVIDEAAAPQKRAGQGSIRLAGATRRAADTRADAGSGASFQSMPWREVSHGFVGTCRGKRGWHGARSRRGREGLPAGQLAAAAVSGNGNASLDFRRRCSSTRRVRNCHEAARIVH